MSEPYGGFFFNLIIMNTEEILETIRFEPKLGTLNSIRLNTKKLYELLPNHKGDISDIIKHRIKENSIYYKNINRDINNHREEKINGMFMVCKTYYIVKLLALICIAAVLIYSLH